MSLVLPMNASFKQASKHQQNNRFTYLRDPLSIHAYLYQSLHSDQSTRQCNQTSSTHRPKNALPTWKLAPLLLLLLYTTECSTWSLFANHRFHSQTPNFRFFETEYGALGLKALHRIVLASHRGPRTFKCHFWWNRLTVDTLFQQA